MTSGDSTRSPTGPPEDGTPRRIGRIDLARWEHGAAWPLAVAALVYLAVYSWQVLDPHLAPGLRRTLHVLDLATWAMFAVDYLTRVWLAPRRAHYVVRHLLDLLIVLLPLLRPLRLLRVMTLIRFIDGRITRTLQGQVAAYVVLSAALVIYGGALAEYEAERDAAGATITSFGTAVWWAITTVSTVGYGDTYPVTTQGRIVAAVMMFAGVALVGSVTASFASWLVGRVQAPRRRTDVHAAELDRLHAEVNRLTALIERHGTGQTEAPHTPPTPTPRTGSHRGAD